MANGVCVFSCWLPVGWPRGRMHFLKVRLGCVEIFGLCFYLGGANERFFLVAKKGLCFEGLIEEGCSIEMDDGFFMLLFMLWII